MKKILLLLTLSASIFSCKKETLSMGGSLGRSFPQNWLYKKVFLSDAFMIWEGEKVTLKIQEESDGSSYSLSGKAAVNTYSGKMIIHSFDSKTGIGNVTISHLSSTKMAGTPEMNQAEISFFDFLNRATIIQLSTGSEPKELTLGIPPQSNNPRDGGYFLSFKEEKITP